MNDEKDKWMEEVFQSMKDSQRAKPHPELFTKIEEELTVSEVKVIPMSQWRIAVAAAVLLLFVNIASLLYYKQSDVMAYENIEKGSTYSESLISNYQIYK